MKLDNDEERRKKRLARFAVNTDTRKATDKIRTNKTDSIIVGCFQTISKPYMRLTSEPNPEFIRPIHILKKAYETFLNEKINKEIEYSRFISEFKSIRQDLTIQRIRDEFTVKVYESNIEISIENEDFNEFNQCITQLIPLYSEVKEQAENDKRLQFIKYNMIRLIFLKEWDSLIEMFIRYKLNQNEKQIMLEWELFDAKIVGDYYKLAQTIESISEKNMLMGKLLEYYLKNERNNIIRVLILSYNQLNFEMLKEKLYFNNIENLGKYLIENKKYQEFIEKKVLENGKELQILNSRKIRLQNSDNF
ncbi:hypothetical protein TBLA_0I00720 [Henningerozyma blattae CBS 6284]|uniref:PCI domain-containing protein n=1 Tax=Henningerozyma blattae (strain ATCC 34711 / CBS 6284 / DSM 70876 / NBRC 10599 / NRRL Y-10934 / UCD 77-7) TaxID=1071380 RepID=I2H8M8_HENB6|nr:hypothetical protein TBLA_0I00720 [Tetrapisispora blattae CBS 6284]CCH62730.1 hypothetical protein TBLA_0I00720 [Tetrapisispora blattae CBS 6284]